MRVNAMTEKFEDVTVLGHPMLFTCARVDRDTVPKGLYKTHNNEKATRSRKRLQHLLLKKEGKVFCIVIFRFTKQCFIIKISISNLIKIKKPSCSCRAVFPFANYLYHNLDNRK